MENVTSIERARTARKANGQFIAGRREWSVPSSSSQRTYRVQETPNGWYCTCPAWKWSKRPARERVCKHVGWVLAEAA